MADLETPRLQLRGFRDEDFEDVHVYASDPEVTRLLSWGPNAPEDTREFLERVQRAALEVPRENHDWALERKSDGRVIGGCGLYNRSERQAEYEIGYCLTRSAWGQSFGKEMMTALLEYGFSSLSAQRIVALIFPRNERSIRLVEGAGFEFEAHVTGQPPTFTDNPPLLLYARMSSG